MIARLAMQIEADLRPLAFDAGLALLYRMSESTAQHRKAAPKSVRCAVVTVSDTRTLADDRGGQLLVEMLTAVGHQIVRREIVPDEPTRIRSSACRASGRGGLRTPSSSPAAPASRPAIRRSKRSARCSPKRSPATAKSSAC